MTQIAVFAHYDINNKIEDYVVFLLKEISKIVDKVVFVSDCELDESELDKINDYIFVSIVGHHGEYDFGSYKRGYLYAQKNHLLDECEQLIFANDSCYGPLYPLNEMFEVMSVKELDVWGITTGFNSHFGKEKHIQSYFVVMKPSVFMNDIFKEFITSIKKEENKKEIVLRYEIGLTKCFDSIGAKRDVYSQFSKQNWASYILSYKHLLKQEQVPFIKRCLVLHKTECFENTKNFCNIISKNTNYNIDFIKEDVKNNRQKLDLKLAMLIVYKYFARCYLYYYRKIFINRKVK